MADRVSFGGVVARQSNNRMQRTSQKRHALCRALIVTHNLIAGHGWSTQVRDEDFPCGGHVIESLQTKP